MKLLKFFTSSSIGTGVDFTIYTVLSTFLFPPVANLISAGAGMVTNYVIQRRFVFEASRSIPVSFILSVLFSLGGIGLGTLFIYILIHIPVMRQQPVLAKIISTAIIFFYNYETKKIAFGDTKERSVASNY